jgi:hypothetical protein
MAMSPTGLSGPTGIGPVSPAASGPFARIGVEAWSPAGSPRGTAQAVRPRPAQHSRDEDRTEVPARRRDRQPYGPSLAYTAGWYAIPALFYLIWLVTLDGDRQALAGRQFVASLPWLFAAVTLSLAVAGLLRWATVGWRVLTLSFAAAVIGSGLVTIAHTLAH